MLFNSLTFLVFFAIVTLLYFSVSHRYRAPLLLIASCYFYMSFNPVYILIIGVTIIIAYFSGILIQKTAVAHRRHILIAGIILVAGFLAFFKYFNFFSAYFNLVASGPGSSGFLRIMLPVGLSFHTFQVISYQIEVYRGNFKPEKNFGIFSLYVMFFPQLIAGPIERPGNLLGQFYEKHEFDFENFKTGFILMAFGFFKKVVIADRLGLIVDPAYKHAGSQSGSTLLISTLLYSFQLYCDFSGYTDIALGSARIMGFRLTNNFNLPYISKSIGEFWTRWHISLSLWLRDYLFLPISYKFLRIIKHRPLGQKPEVWAYCVATIVTMTIAGIWHGESWGFVIWGLFHGVLLVASFVKKRIYKAYKIRTHGKRFLPVVQAAATFLLVSFGWVFFRSASLSTAVTIIGKIFSSSVFAAPRFALNYVEMLFSVFLIILISIKEYFRPEIRFKTNAGFFAGVIFIAFLCYLFGVFEQKQFIYFQF